MARKMHKDIDLSKPYKFKCDSCGHIMYRKNRSASQTCRICHKYASYVGKISK